MKKEILSICAFICAVLLAQIAVARQVSVKGYYRKDGTYVAPHVRNINSGSGNSSTYRIPSYSGTSSYSRPSFGTSAHESPSHDLSSLPQCKALNEDGTKCVRPANPGIDYCYRHVDYGKTRTLETEEDKIDKTRGWLNDIDRAIGKYSKSTKRPPDDIKELQVQMGGMVHSKDAWDMPFVYETDEDGYSIVSNGPDKKSGTADDIVFVRQGKNVFTSGPQPSSNTKSHGSKTSINAPTAGHSKSCRAIMDNGLSCSSRALPGKEYCAAHAEGKQHVATQSKPVDRETVLHDSKLRIKTLATIDAIRRSITKYMDENGGVPPKDITEMSVPTNDAWGNAFYYDVDGKCYAIFSDGPDGVSDTPDDILFFSKQQPLCQAVLSDGVICGRRTESGGWYCPKHRSSHVKNANEVRRSTYNESSYGKLWNIVDVILILLLVGIVVLAFRWTSGSKVRK